MTLLPDAGHIDHRWSMSAEDEALDGMDDRVTRLLGELAVDHRSVLALRIVAGLSVEETA
jgi:hypothetical protein